jgi:multidrug efflux pump subunit AcrB
MLLILSCGVAGYFTMIREIFPRFSLDKITVSVSYPGADPDEIEEGIAIKLEEAIDGLEGVKEITTTSQEGLCVALIECADGTDITRVKDRVKNAVDAITTFPKDAENPVVSEVEFRDAVCSIVLWGDGVPERQLKELARSMEREILRLPGISQTGISGIRDYEISIEVNEGKLRKYDLDFDILARAVRAYGINLSSGTLRTRREDIRLKAFGRRYTAKDYRDIPVVTRPDGTRVLLGDVAEIRDAFDEGAKVFSLFNGEPAVAINIYKTEKEDSIKIVKRVDGFIAEKRGILPSNLHIAKFMDHSRMVKDRLHILVSNGIIGLCLVFVSLWLFLDMRLSFWVAMGIPISLAGALAVMAVCGASINMISMFGMIMVLGLIVDDAIVVGESIYHHRLTGSGPMDAAVRGTAEVAFPVIAAVLTTIIAFLPLFFIPGIMGKFIRVMPVPVVASLAISMVECLFILPVHLRHLPRPDAPPKLVISKRVERLRAKLNSGLTWFVEDVYGRAMRKILPNRYLAVSIAIAVVFAIAGVIKGGLIKFSLLPASDDDFIQAKIELPAGTPASETLAVARRITDAWKKVENLPEFKEKLHGQPLSTAVYSLVGASLDWRQPISDPNKFEVSIELLPSEERNILATDLVTAWKDAAGDIPGAVATSFSIIQKGPGGMPIAFDLMGEDKDELARAADELAAAINKKSGTYDVTTDYRAGKREFAIRLKPAAAKYGITLADVAKHVQSGFFGNEALRIQIGRDDVKVKIKYPKSDGRDSVGFFKRIRVRNKNGRMIPLTSVAKIELVPGPSVIKRKYRMRKIRVESDIDRKLGNANEIIRDLEKSALPKLEKKYGVTCEIAGQQMESRDSLGSLWLLFPIAMFGIYFIIASIFRSYIQPMIIMTTIPFGMIGAILGHFIFMSNLCIFSMFGMVALAGIVVNDAIVFIECANNNLAAGEKLFDSLVNAGKRRFRAIMLTTLTTFAGLMPLILERSVQAAYLKPMAISIAFGVLFATGITLVLIPCAMGVLNDIRRLTHYLITGERVSREAVETRAKKELLESEEE